MLYFVVLTWVLVAVFVLWCVFEAVRHNKSNCVFWALPRWVRRASDGHASYLVIRLSFIPWGFFHCLLGEVDKETGQLALRSLKPKSGKKEGFAPLFHGEVTHGDTYHGAETPPVDTRKPP